MIIINIYQKGRILIHGNYMSIEGETIYIWLHKRS